MNNDLSHTKIYSRLLNYQLLEYLIHKLKNEIRFNPEKWIINVIPLFNEVIEMKEESDHRGMIVSYLQNSAIIAHGNRMYQNQDIIDCKHREEIHKEKITIGDSLSGFCVIEQNRLWIDDLQKISKSSKQKNIRYGPVYRSYLKIGTTPKEPIKSEYIFPIKSFQGYGSTVIGVLNAECTLQEFENNEFYKNKDEVIDIITDILRIHGPYLATVISLEDHKLWNHGKYGLVGITNNSVVFEKLLESHKEAIRIGEVVQ